MAAEEVTFTINATGETLTGWLVDDDPTLIRYSSEFGVMQVVGIEHVTIVKRG